MSPVADNDRGAINHGIAASSFAGDSTVSGQSPDNVEGMILRNRSQSRVRNPSRKLSAICRCRLGFSYRPPMQLHGYSAAFAASESTTEVFFERLSGSA